MKKNVLLYICIALLCGLAELSCNGGGGGDEDGDADAEQDVDSEADGLEAVEDAEEEDGAGDVEDDGVSPDCGNSVVNEGEECDDGRNGNPDDGCTDDCAYSCHENPDCEDGNMCNGDDVCDRDEHICVRLSPPEDGTECGEGPRRICLDGECVESECGDGFVDEGESEQCDDGNDTAGDGCEDDCTWSCDDDEDCDDGHVCTDDTCDTEGSHACTNPLSSLSTLCRPADGNCDADEYCDGENPDCPEDGPSPEGAACNDGDPCTFPDVCSAEGVCEAAAAGFDGAYAVSAGMNHTCVLTVEGGVKCWGHNAWGQLGNGGTADSRHPADVTGLGSGVIALDAGSNFNCAVTTGGGVKCWGANSRGQLGDGTTAMKREPVDVTGLDTGVWAVSAGYEHTCALTDGGGVKCWGANSRGQLGDGTTTDRREPVEITELMGGALAISAGGYHTCVVLETGAVKCWGHNDRGQLGNGTTTRSLVPVDVSGMDTGAIFVSAGYEHTCALMSGGDVKCWGENLFGRLGDGTTTDRHEPVGVIGLAPGAIEVSAGDEHTCSLITTDGVKCWGHNDWGQLGDGSTDDRHAAFDVSGLTSGAAGVSCGGEHCCAVIDPRGVMCWGHNNRGQLGDGSATSSSVPVAVVCEEE